ncbi:hypothetical protein FS749_014519 [Ceratobasidium sp. UAMH 11750]|nr:hypothetical protein FS749_014519 [Ceratobasidium sp. UAMH 11750]
MDVDSDSSREGDLSLYNPRARPPKPDPRIQTQTKPKNGTPHQSVHRPTKLSSGPRLTTSRTRPSSHLAEKAERGLGPNTHVNSLNDGGFEMSFVPLGRADSDEEQRSARKSRKGGAGGSGGKVERFGAGMERGGRGKEEDVKENERNGRTKRRTGVRSGSKNAFRRG